MVRVLVRSRTPMSADTAPGTKISASPSPILNHPSPCVRRPTVEWPPPPNGAGWWPSMQRLYSLTMGPRSAGTRCSILAVKVATGELKWHYQLLHPSG